jgi:hypothetical protein
MHTQDAIADQSCHWQAIECIREELPHLHVVSTFALVQKSIFLGISRQNQLVPTEFKEN